MFVATTIISTHPTRRRNRNLIKVVILSRLQTRSGSADAALGRLQFKHHPTIHATRDRLLTCDGVVTPAGFSVTEPSGATSGEYHRFKRIED